MVSEPSGVEYRGMNVLYHRAGLRHLQTVHSRLGMISIDRLVR